MSIISYYFFHEKIILSRWKSLTTYTSWNQEHEHSWNIFRDSPKSGILSNKWCTTPVHIRISNSSGKFFLIAKLILENKSIMISLPIFSLKKYGSLILLCHHKWYRWTMGKLIPNPPFWIWEEIFHFHLVRFWD